LLGRARDRAPHGTSRGADDPQQPGLGYQKDAEDVLFGAHTDVCHLAPVDHAQIARACGWRAERIEDPEAYRPALEAAIAASEPTLLDVITDLEAHPPITMFEGKLAR
jgi:acetolactate synthase-1/2/3 large subunit